MKKIFALMLVFAMLFAFASCSGKNNTEETTAPTQSNTEASTVAVYGKTIMLKDNDSLDFVELITDSSNLGMNIMIYKFFDTEAEFAAAKEKGSYDNYTLISAIDANRQIIYSDSITINGMPYEELILLAEKAEGYTIIPVAE